MKYYYEKTEHWVGAGKIWQGDHPMFNRATLFEKENKGLLIIQEHFNTKIKARWYGPVDPWLAGDIYFHENFLNFFEQNAKIPDQYNLYPVFIVRKVMWALRMKPLKKEYWEEWEGQSLR